MPGLVAAETNGDHSKAKESKNQRRRRLRKEKQDQDGTDTPQVDAEVKDEPQVKIEPRPVKDDDEDVVIDSIKDVENDPMFAQFKTILAKFQESDETDRTGRNQDKPQVYFDDDDDIPDDPQEALPMSRKKRKQLTKLSVAELKAIVEKPDLVEWTDTDATDPRLLVALKGYRNVIPVPAHWSLKREYLSTKRGVEKPPFALPKFIADTGIAKMRDAVLEKQDSASLKQKMRERVQPKMGRLDIDYQKLYEAFFRFQTKPELTRYGEVYYEGKEFETNLRHLRPGDLSDELKEALSIPPGAPPPWLINQQRYGPPPSYPALKIPGLNAPPPPGGQWGYHPGGFGKPPVDEHNRPLYGGDIFGVMHTQQPASSGEPVERNLWGELQENEESEEEAEEEGQEQDQAPAEEAVSEDEDMDISKGRGAKEAPGTESVAPSNYGGVESVAGDFTLRKQKSGTETEEPRTGRSAGQVISEKTGRVSGFFGSDRTYDLRGTANEGLPVLGQERNDRKRRAGDVDVSVDVDALEREDTLSKEQLAKQYESQRQAQAQEKWGGYNGDDLTDMIAEENRKRLKKEEDRRNRR